MAEKPPANYAATIISLGSLGAAFLSIVIGLNKADADQAKEIERRLCRIEAHTRIGECGR